MPLFQCLVGTSLFVLGLCADLWETYLQFYSLSEISVRTVERTDKQMHHSHMSYVGLEV